MAQTLIVGLIVACSAAYVLWALLLPAAVQRRVARALLRRRWPAVITVRLQALSQAQAPCSCEGCDARAPQGTPQPVHWAPRRGKGC